MPADAKYDDIADWYETVFLVDQRTMESNDIHADRLGIDRALVDLLGAGDGLCLEVGCGTGIYADRIRGLGWYPVGVDLSAGMLRYAKTRLPTIRGDAYLVLVVWVLALRGGRLWSRHVAAHRSLHAVSGLCPVGPWGV